MHLVKTDYLALNSTDRIPVRIGDNLDERADQVKYLGSVLHVTVQLPHKFAIRASDGPMKLLKVIKNPVTSHLPVGARKVITSFSSKVVQNCRELVPKDDPIVMIVGAMAHGKVEVDYSEDAVSISNYPLSASLTCAKLCSAFEEVWGVV